MTDYSTCRSPTCGTTVEGRVAVCPKCGGAMRGVGESRARGWVLLGLGLFLVIFMGVIAMAIAPQMLRPGEEVGGSTFTGTADQAQLVFALFGAVILFGAVSAAYGVFIIRTGRQSATFISATLALAALLFAIGWAIMGWKG